MEPINCLIIDDEPLARDLLVNYCSLLPTLCVAGICGNALDAKKLLQEQKIDLIFLDINMPMLDGIGFLKTVTNRPEVIMTTAYKEYAVNAFDLAVCDYLVKPFSLERFIISVNRAEARLNSTKGIVQKDTNRDNFIFLKTDGKIYRIEFDTLLFAEANGNYTRVVTLTNTLTLTMPFSGLEKLLPVNRFIKIHRSFIVNKAKIVSIEGNRVFINQHEIPIGRNYRDDFLNRLEI
ncbi:LytR/AlgR family response regulator transcription factor [Chitinophaga ginsengisoli]|uniref:LytTR family two component transcriptional regulator n=1 Tax=Chitinophaga ginsengisoli TaxID=363837 RepID=A0A2P8GAW2_9BACT|nr:LytTR family DNA-binding domain-containing protein [Chitinophaga ginsengisoli]PSL31035.1 LytTR family two component transcriptional regulator [Chitinophaga ginsengisoli]